MLKYKESDIIVWKGQKGVVQHVGELGMIVFFVKSGKLEIFNTDGTHNKDAKCLKVDLFPVKKNSMTYSEQEEKSINSKSKYHH